MIRPLAAFAFAAGLILLPAPVAVAQGVRRAPQVTAVGGTWDLTWETRRGPRREGYLVIVQHGADIEAEIHGKGAIKASGTAGVGGFWLSGRRMLVPYTIFATVTGGRMRGSFKVLSVERRFSGVRR
jgi:hypothetical protein